MQHPEATNRFKCLSTDLLTALCVCIGQQQSKFLSAIPGGEIRWSANLLGQDPRNRAQATVAPWMAVQVIEFLEVINIDHQQR